MIFIDRFIKNSPSWLNWNSPILKALIGNKNAVQDTKIESSINYRCGAICNELELFYNGIIKEIKNRDYRESKDDFLFYFGLVFFGIKPLAMEDRAFYIRRLNALSYLDGVKTKTTKEAIVAFLNNFYTFVDVIEGINNENNASFYNWSVSNVIDTESESFTRNALKIDSNTSLTHTLNIEPSYRRIVFYTKGRADGILKVNEKEYSFSSDVDDWKQHSFFIDLTQTSTVNLEIKADNAFIVDYFNLFQKENPCFTVLIKKQDKVNSLTGWEAITQYTNVRESYKKDEWAYYLRPNSLNVASEDWVLSMIDKIKAKGVLHTVKEV